MIPLSDFELIVSAQNGDQNSLETLLVQYKNLVCKIARNYFLVGGDSDDLIQEGTFGLIKAIKEFSPTKGKAFSTFAYLCISSKIIDAVRSYNRDKYKLVNLARPLSVIEDSSEEYLVDALDSVPDPLTIYIDAENQENFYKILSSILPNKQLIVLKLYLEGYSYIEIANRLSLSPKTIDNYITIAKNKIRKSKDKF